MMKVAQAVLALCVTKGMSRRLAIVLLILVPSTASLAQGSVNDPDYSACSLYIAAMVTHNEDMYPAEMPKWKASCEKPPQDRCKELNEMLQRRRGISPLHCDGGTGH